jgi:3-deoxy-D-manno-oct-2-ulosonic acid (Kdo) hydroxylase
LMSPCEKLIYLPHKGWAAPASTDVVHASSAGIETGKVLFLPELRFESEPRETALFTPAILGSSKNASFDPATGRLGGTTAIGGDAELLRALLRRFSDAAASLVRELLPRYRDVATRGRASFRPAEIAGRASSWRKDDTRLHVDSFPATPTRGRRILRVFSNVNPSGKARAWRIGGEFESVARRFEDALSLPLPGSGYLLALVRVTKSPRSAYDALMLQLHDRMKGDDEFQRSSPQSAVDFPAGSTWLALTDEVSHAALAGQYQLEQTFLVPVSAMLDESRSPLRILERLKGRRLA